MSITVPFIDFTCDVMSIPGVDCGSFSYTVVAIAQDPVDLDYMISLAANSADMTIDMTLDKALI